MPIKAYSYVRFSRPEQMHGDSLRRQAELAEDYCIKNDLDLDTTLKMQDRGVPAFRGQNVLKGALGAFLKKVESGDVEKGSYLLIESLDRLSRQDIEDSLRLFLNILDKGVIIVTLSAEDSRKYERGKLDLTDFIITIVIMGRAHGESVRKSENVGKAWANKRSNAQTKPLTKWVPAWLELSEDRTTIRENHEKVEVVKKIFQWCLQGLGTTLIIKRLEEEGIEPLGAPENIKLSQSTESRNRQPAKWHSSRIARILHDRAVLGEYQPRKNIKGQPDGVILGYYPQIIDEETYYRVQQERKSRNVRVSKKGAGRKGKTVSNLFSGIAVCGYSLNDNRGLHRCAGNSEPMVYINKGNKYLIRYLQCSRLKNGNTGCDLCRKLWRYDYFETAFLTHVKEIDASVLTGSADDLKNAIENIKKKIAALEEKQTFISLEIKKLSEAKSQYERIPKFLIEDGIQLEEDQEENKMVLERLQEELKTKEYEYKNTSIKKDELVSLIETMEGLEDQQLFDLRLQLAQVLQQVIDRIEVYVKGEIACEQFVEKVRRARGKKLANIVAESIREQEIFDQGRVSPFFIVKYKSGEQRFVMPDSGNPARIIITQLSDEEGLIEMDTSIGKGHRKGPKRYR